MKMCWDWVRCPPWRDVPLSRSLGKSRVAPRLQAATESCDYLAGFGVAGVVGNATWGIFRIASAAASAAAAARSAAAAAFLAAAEALWANSIALFIASFPARALARALLAISTSLKPSSKPNAGAAGSMGSALSDSGDFLHPPRQAMKSSSAMTFAMGADRRPFMAESRACLTARPEGRSTERGRRLTSIS